MAFANKFGNLVKNAINSSPSLFQSIRCMSSSKLFVGGISYSTDDPSLEEAFSSYGTVVEARVIMDRETGRSRGFGFVTFTSSEEATHAISGMDGKELHGRNIRVNYANDRTVGGYGGGYGGSGGGYTGGGGGSYGGSGGGYTGGGGGSYGGSGGGYTGGGGGSYGGSGGGYTGGGGGSYGGSGGGYTGGGGGEYGAGGNFGGASSGGGGSYGASYGNATTGDVGSSFDDAKDDFEPKDYANKQS